MTWKWSPPPVRSSTRHLGRVRERGAKKRLEALGGHAALGGDGTYPVAMEEIGLFPLGIVLLPTERVPLHIFEPRYRELIGECIERRAASSGSSRGRRRRARASARGRASTEVLERFEDGRLNIVVEGGERFRVELLTRGRSFITADVEPVEDESAERRPGGGRAGAESFRALAEAADAEAGSPTRARRSSRSSSRRTSSWRRSDNGNDMPEAWKPYKFVIKGKKGKPYKYLVYRHNE